MSQENDNNQEVKSSRIKDYVNKNKKTLIIIGITISIILAISVTYGIIVVNNVKAWEEKIYSGVSVYGVDLGGLTKEEAVSKLGEKLPELIMDKKIDILVGDKTIEMKYSDISPVYDLNVIADEAIKYGKDNTILGKNNLIKNGSDYKIEPAITYNEEHLKAFEDKVKTEVNIASKDAQISINSGNISITPDIMGYVINSEDLHNKLIESINGNPDEVIELKFDLEESPARIRESELQKITGRMSSYSNTYTGGDSTGRFINMKLATQTISGTLLMPGDEFSYNTVVGNTTPDKGYQQANTYVGNEIVPGYGGGVCQVSTALYRAVMRSNIRSTERMNHSMTVSYSEPGEDATIAYGYIDYKFKNTYDFPIYIEGFAGGGSIGFNIYGNPSALGGKTYDVVGVINETYNPKVEYKDDATLLEGKEIVESNGMVGYKATGYLVTYENGVEINRERIATDNYKTMNKIVKRGTKKPEQQAEPEKKPEEPKPDEQEHEDTEG